MSDAATWISAAAAVVSVGAAIWATLKSSKAQDASNCLQRKLAEIEEAREKDRVAQKGKAEVGAELVSEQIGSFSGRTTHRLRILNRGQAEAREVTVTMDGKPILEHPAIPGGSTEIRQVGPGAHFQYVLAISNQCHPPFVVAITWEDDSGIQGSFTTPLSF